MAFEMNSDGQIVHLGTPEFAPILKNAVFDTGDAILDEMLEDAIAKFQDRDPKIRRESLEKIWDAFERLKTIEEPDKDKRSSCSALLARAVPEASLREQIDKEMRSLTEIGNNFMIRHAEIDKTPITQMEVVDYLFQRMFGVIRLLLKGTRRGG
jgi:hypothetical protein